MEKWGIDFMYFIYLRLEIVEFVFWDVKWIFDVGCGVGVMGLEF